ncbi:MAG: Crp/Fnr family transcriptional regulator [Bdellovibrionia bacterium]
MEQLENLRKFLSGMIEMPESEWLYLTTLLKPKKLEKDAFNFRQGDEVSEIAFVARGLLYNFYTDANGEDFVKFFISEGGVVSCYSSLLQGIPASYSSRALEPVTLVTLQYSDLKKLYERHPCWERMGRVMVERLYIEKERREQRFLMADAKTRYESFTKERSELVNRVPQYLIASYIGISPVSLSRLRKN